MMTGAVGALAPGSRKLSNVEYEPMTRGRQIDYQHKLCYVIPPTGFCSPQFLTLKWSGIGPNPENFKIKPSPKKFLDPEPNPKPGFPGLVEIPGPTQ